MGCDYGIDGDGTWEVCETDIRTAGKDHVCCECGKTIHKECPYEHTSILNEGSWHRAKTCMGCANVRDVLCHGGAPLEGMWNHLFVYELDYAAPCCLDKLNAEGKAKVAEMIDAYIERIGHPEVAHAA